MPLSNASIANRGDGSSGSLRRLHATVGRVPVIWWRMRATASAWSQSMHTTSPPASGSVVGAQPSQLLVGDAQHLAQVVAVQRRGRCAAGRTLPARSGRRRRRPSRWCRQASGTSRSPDGGELQRSANAVRKGLAVGVGVVGYRPAVPGLDEDDGILGAEGGAGQAEDAGLPRP